ncbi:MAG: prohibitin family protein [Clostridia bacterium]|nr:prohibitin family protein [Clostridia bacterium]
MVIGVIIGFAIIAATVILGSSAFSSFRKGKKGSAKVLGVICALLVFSLFVIPLSFHTVESGEVAVVKTLGKITDIRTAGTNFDFWITTSYTKYDTKVQDVEIKTAAYSSDAQTMDILMTLQYQIMPDKVMDIATQYGPLSALESRIISITTEKTKAVLSSYKAMDIIANRATISPSVEQSIKDAIGEEYFVNVTAVVLTNIDFSDAFELAVEEKMIAEQAKLKADYENQTKIAQAEAEAEAKIKAAEAEIEIAKAEAEALKIAAQAEAEANKILTESLTEKVLQSKFYEVWDGKLPTVMGDNAVIADISKMQQ